MCVSYFLFAYCFYIFSSIIANKHTFAQNEVIFFTIYVIASHLLSEASFCSQFVFTQHKPLLRDKNRTQDVVIDPVGLQVTQYCMNWGWGGSFDNAYFVSSANGWHAGGTYYQYRGNAIGYFSPID